jgi:UDP-N-acetylmuramoylalanine--D-glutamate ligase
MKNASMKLEGARVAVVGMARSGWAAMELLAEKGASVIGVDKNAVPDPFVKPQTPEAFADVDLIVLSPGVPADLEDLQDARRREVPVVGELELASWFLQGDVVGITGSNGKTTTTALAGHILKESGIPAQVGGNIGTPPASMVKSSRKGQWNVLELSSFQLETICSFHARVGAVLNVTPDHLDRHYTMERYAASKGRLFENQTAEDFAVLNADDPLARVYPTTGQKLWFSSKSRVSPGAWAQNDCIVLDGDPLMDIREVPLRGRHNVENVMAAALIAGVAGATNAQIRSAVKSFPGVEHRLEFVRELDGVAWYNDSKATNVDATLKAIDAFPGGLWVILGGKDKNTDYTPLLAPLRERARGILLIGAAAAKIESQLSGAAPLIGCGTLDTAVKQARSLAGKGEIVVLAPACASFDQFENFEHRGREFKRLVREL